MTRIDAWELRVEASNDAIDIGAAKDLDVKYSAGPIIGEGGFGIVKIVTEKATGKEFACKSICKRLVEKDVTGKRQARHIENIRREVAVLKRLRGTLNVAHFVQVFEDKNDVHIVMEYCRGGELHHRIGNKHYTERTVSLHVSALATVQLFPLQWVDHSLSV